MPPSPVLQGSTETGEGGRGSARTGWGKDDRCTIPLEPGNAARHWAGPVDLATVPPIGHLPAIVYTLPIGSLFLREPERPMLVCTSIGASTSEASVLHQINASNSTRILISTVALNVDLPEQWFALPMSPIYRHRYILLFFHHATGLFQPRTRKEDTWEAAWFRRVSVTLLPSE